MENPPVARRRKSQWRNFEALVEGMARAYELCQEDGAELTQRSHRQLAKRHPGVVPNPAVVDRNAKKLGTTAEAIRDEAKRRRNDRRRGS